MKHIVIELVTKEKVRISEEKYAEFLENLKEADGYISFTGVKDMDGNVHVINREFIVQMFPDEIQ